MHIAVPFRWFLSVAAQGAAVAIGIALLLAFVGLAAPVP
jgi:hypothetical protein